MEIPQTMRYTIFRLKLYNLCLLNHTFQDRRPPKLRGIKQYSVNHTHPEAKGTMFLLINYSSCF